MAHLNLRDRVIETTIAYVGAVHDSGSRNLAHVRIRAGKGRTGALEEMAVEGGRKLKLDWRPRESMKLNDCELTVSLVSGVSDGPDRMMDMLVDADGLVLVLESGADASEKNQLALATVREVMARAPKKRLPVVVQLNQTDGEGTIEVPIDEDWPRLEACVAKGDGVMETLQRAVDGVVESIQGRDADAAPRPFGSPRTEGNPLLGALRQILVATVTDQIASMESRILEKLEKSMAPRGGDGEATTRLLASFDSRLERLALAIAALGERANARAVDSNEAAPSRADVERMGARVASEVKTHREAVNVQLAAFEAWMERLESTVIEASDRAAAAIERTASRADMERIDARIAQEALTQRDAVVGEMKEHRKAVRDEVLRAATTATTPIQRAVEALSQETKKWASNDADVVSVVKAQGTKSDGLRGQLEALVIESRAVAGQVDDLAGHMKKVDTQIDDVAVQMKLVDAQVGRRIAEIRDALKASGERNEGLVEALQVELAALTDELRKKNKGWFG